jgi:hypothetical protein
MEKRGMWPGFDSAPTVRQPRYPHRQRICPLWARQSAPLNLVFRLNCRASNLHPLHQLTTTETPKYVNNKMEKTNQTGYLSTHARISIAFPI